MRPTLVLPVAALTLAAARAPQMAAPPGAGLAHPTALSPAVLFDGAPGSFGQIVVVDELAARPIARPPRLAAVRLLPIDFVGRTELEALLPDRPRTRDDVPGASRLVLPQGQGSLYRIELDLGAGRAFAFLLVGPRGGPRVLAEVPGTGVDGDGDPYLERIAVDPAGRGLLAATRVAAGGNLLEVDLVSGAVVDRTADRDPVAFARAGLWLHDGWGIGAGPGGVLRFERDAGATAALVPFDPPADLRSGEVVVSRNREWGATVAGDSAVRLYAYVFGRQGTAQRVGDKGMRLSGAGFLPDHAGGPSLAVSDDGQLCAFAVEGVAREVFLGRVEQASPPTQVSADAYFIDTIDQVGALGFFSAGALSMTMGSFDPNSPIEDVDVFSVELPAPGNPVFTNLTLSSGDATPPFESPGAIDPSVMRVTPDGALLIHDDEGEDLLALQPDGDLEILVPDVKSMEFVERVGDVIVIGVRRSFDPRPKELYELTPTGLGATLLHSDSPDENYLYPTTSEHGVAFVARDEDTLAERFFGVDLRGPTVEVLTTAAAAFTPPVAFVPSGSLMVTEGTEGGPNRFLLLRPGGTLDAVRRGPVQGHLLPGR